MGLSGSKPKPVAGGADKDVVTAAQQIKEPSDLQKKLDARALDYFAWDEGTGKYAGRPKDITEAPGMGNLLDVYGNAEAIAQNQRVGDPLVAFSGGSGRSLNPYLKQLTEQNKMKMYDARASALNAGLAGLKDEAVTGAQYGNENEMRRREGYSNAIAGYNDRFYNRPQRPNPWMQALGLAVGGVGAMGGGAGIAKLAAI